MQINAIRHMTRVALFHHLGQSFHPMTLRTASRSGRRSKSRSLVFFVLLMGIGVFAVAATFDRMENSEMFLRRIYPNLFGTAERYRAQFVEAASAAKHRAMPLEVKLFEVPPEQPLVPTPTTVQPSPEISAVVGAIVAPGSTSGPAVSRTESGTASSKEQPPANPVIDNKDLVLSAEITFAANGKVRRFSASGPGNRSEVAGLSALCGAPRNRIKRRRTRFGNACTWRRILSSQDRGLPQPSSDRDSKPNHCL